MPLDYQGASITVSQGIYLNFRFFNVLLHEIYVQRSSLTRKHVCYSCSRIKYSQMGGFVPQIYYVGCGEFLFVA